MPTKNNIVLSEYPGAAGENDGNLGVPLIAGAARLMCLLLLLF